METYIIIATQQFGGKRGSDSPVLKSQPCAQARKHSLDLWLPPETFKKIIWFPDNKGSTLEIHQWPVLCIPFLPLLGPATWLGIPFFPLSHMCTKWQCPETWARYLLLDAECYFVLLFYWLTHLLLFYFVILLFCSMGGGMRAWSQRLRCQRVLSLLNSWGKKK